MVPPATDFSSFTTDLGAVIGGTRGEALLVTAFTADPLTRTYSITLQLDICDDFGVDEADLYLPGLMSFWVLQHERSATLYRPFVNQLELTLPIFGVF